jgi:aspartate kinase
MNDNILKVGVQKLIINRFNELQDDISLFLWNKNKNIIPSKNNDYLIDTKDKQISLLWFWEILSSEIQSYIINHLYIEWLSAQSVELNWVFKWIDRSQTESIIYDELSTNISMRVNEVLLKNNIAIIPGYISGAPNWIESMVGRWYSDATAAMTSVWLSNSNEVILEIQKSVEWILSADPSVLEHKNAKLIKEIDYITAKEITWSRGAQAKLLHSQVLKKQLQIAGIKLHLFDPFKNTKWTVITKNKSNKSSWVEYVWARDNIIFFSISSGHMEGVWILSSIFDIVKQYKPVDIVSTSETEISFTIDNEMDDSTLLKMQEQIRIKLWFEVWDERNKVEYSKNKALVFCIWQNLSHSMWALARAANCFEKWWINVELVSQWVKERAMVFWINWKDMDNAVNLLHEEFIK